MDNAVVLSEDLEEKAVQTLVNVVIEDLFPEACDKWRVANQDIHAKYEQELVKRKDTISQEIAKGEDSLLRILREVVVEDVMKLFPWAFVGDTF
jgi:F0F1-type ATP synthase membrane subunit b/b'